jgi:hypothetical protein
MRRENWYRMGLMWSVSAAVASAVRCHPDPRVATRRVGARDRRVANAQTPRAERCVTSRVFATRVGVRIIFKPERRAQCSPITHTLGATAAHPSSVILQATCSRATYTMRSVLVPERGKRIGALCPLFISLRPTFLLLLLAACRSRAPLRRKRW